jgi:hypothetical protein
MKKMLTLLATLASAATCLAQSPIAGDWQGVLNTGAGNLRLVLHISDAPDGSLNATIVSVDQSPKAIPVTAISLKGSKLSLAVTAVHATYEGSVNKDETEIDGTWSQRQQLPLTFNRTSAPITTGHGPAPPSDIDGAWMGALDIGGLGTHSLRHTYRSWLDAVGTSIAVQQKLMRHADIRATMNVYGDIVTDEMAQANSKVVGLALKGSLA